VRDAEKTEDKFCADNVILLPFFFHWFGVDNLVISPFMNETLLFCHPVF